MKATTIRKAILIFALLPAAVGWGQDWQLVNSGVTSDLYDIFFIDKTTGWAVGEDSTIIKTTDEGYTWFRQTGGVPLQYRCVFFLDSLNGWIGGGAGLLLHTTDGGDTWERQTTPYPMDVNSVFFINDSIGWIAAAHGGCGTYFCNGSLLKTTNAGMEWKEILRTPLYLSYDSTSEDSLYEGRFHDIVFLDDTTGCACGEIFDDRSYNIGSIICTSDGGSNWFHVTDWTRWTATYKLGMISTDTIYGATRHGVVRTYDGGVTYWDFFTPTASTFDLSLKGDRYVYAIGQYAGQVNIRIYIDGSKEPINQTLEGGPIRKPDLDDPGLFMGLFMLDTASGWVCGHEGKLWRRPAMVDGIEPMPAPGNLDIAIESVYPNPLALNDRGTATVRFRIRRESALAFEVRDVLGRVVLRKYNTTPYPPGLHEETLPLHGLRAGMYFLSVQSVRGTSGNVILFIR